MKARSGSALKITKINVKALKTKATGAQDTATASITSKESCIVEIHTDDGLVGIGDAQRPESPQAMCYIIKDLFSQILLNSDPSNIEQLWHSMYHIMRTRGRTKGLTIEAMSAVDMALWDLFAKSLRLPIYKVLGGKYNDKIRCYATEIMYGKPNQERLKDAESFVKNGFNAFKVTVGADLDKDAKFIGELRDRFGLDVDIAVDANCALSFKSAVRFAKALERFQLLWLEEPMPPEFLNDYVELRKLSMIPIAAGESEFTVYGFKDWIASHALDIVQPDVGRVGGITQSKKVANMAEAFGLSFAPHIGHGSALVYAATMHLATSSPNFLIFELEQVDNPLRERLLSDRIDLQTNGFLRAPEKPGLGVDLNLDFVKTCQLMELTIQS